MASKKQKIHFMLLIPLILGIWWISGVEATSSFDKDLTLTRSQKLALDKFRQRVVGSGKIPHAYMKQDIYLIRWLRAKNYNVEQAEQMLKENIAWRRHNKMDTILEEDWTEFRETFPYYLDTVAKDGKPMITANFGEWDIRAVTVSGQMPKMIRYLAKYMEDAAKTVRSMQEKGANVTQYDFLVNMDSYNLVQHGCIQCISFYLALVNTYENYYPGFADNIVLFKTPPVFEVVLNVIRPFMSPITRNSLKVIGQDKAQWTRAMLEIAEKSQLTPEYGGVYVRE